MHELLRARLEALAEPEFQKFSSALIPGATNMLGVRLPVLRTLAKELAKRDYWRVYLAGARDNSFEEILLQGMVVGYAKAELTETLELAAAFVPKIDNWAVCDSFCNTLKQAQRHPEPFWEFLQPYLHDAREFHVRFGVVMLLSHFITPTYIERVLAALNAVRQEGYYTRMGVAWAVSVCFVKFPELTMPFLEHTDLDDFSYNKALQKITESLRVDATVKSRIRAMKRKEQG